MRENPIINELNAMAGWQALAPQQLDYYRQMASDAKSVQMTPVREVFTPAELKLIKDIVKPEGGKCYRNAALLAELFPDRVKYVEGFGWQTIIKLEHAFNRVGDKYVDITWEMALGQDVSETPYVSLIEATGEEVVSDIEAHDNTTGDYYLHTYLKNHGGDKYHTTI